MGPETFRRTTYCLFTRKEGNWAQELAVNRHTLIPRPETETLVEEALKLMIPDLGTASGAIAHERKQAQITAISFSAEAIHTATANTDASSINNTHA